MHATIIVATTMVLGPSPFVAVPELWLVYLFRVSIGLLACLISIDLYGHSRLGASVATGGVASGKRRLSADL
jgi:hypothetical protein